MNTNPTQAGALAQVVAEIDAHITMGSSSHDSDKELRDWRDRLAALSTPTPEPDAGREDWQAMSDAIAYAPEDIRDAARLAFYRQHPTTTTSTQQGEPTITIQEAWEAAGGNPDIRASKQELLDALCSMDEAIDEIDTCPATRAEGVDAAMARFDALATIKPSDATGDEAWRWNCECVSKDAAREILAVLTDAQGERESPPCT